MKIRNKKTKDIGSSGKFNIHSLSEIYVYFDDWMDTDYMSNYDVYIEKLKEWKDLNQAFKDKDLITNNYNTYFFEPENDEERKQGCRL